MYVQLKTRRLIPVAGLALLLTGLPVLAEKPAPKTDEPILLMLGKEQDLTGCKMLGKVSGTSEDNDATYPERMIIARDKLRAETARLGGNAVHVLQTYNTARYAIPGIEQKIMFSGNAYFCE
ncbi:protein of unknown function [Nitrosomonas sp. Nm51]|uniref:DUF4156 domain-containing protein n=1 Tax=Nitrosomonas sp. Nm51 TaxID=133720 RepID=UPI0008D19BA9|nr:DUF4156 domain-containing protein [Nitrosomonas sp. Nm51]SEQ85093.1 protein of unknown function [Nitrosomonas sp. Nm51]